MVAKIFGLVACVVVRFVGAIDVGVDELAVDVRVLGGLVTASLIQSNRVSSPTGKGVTTNLIELDILGVVGCI